MWAEPVGSGFFPWEKNPKFYRNSKFFRYPGTGTSNTSSIIADNIGNNSIRY